MSIVVYALGGGLGHAVRASSLVAELVRRGRDARVLLPVSKLWVARALGAEAVGVERTESPAELGAFVAREVDARSHLVVDALPAGLLGELGACTAGRRTALVRLHRDVPALLRDLKTYDDVIDIEPGLDWLPLARARRIGPIVRTLGEVETTLDVLIVAADDALRRFGDKLAGRLKAQGVRVLSWPAGELLDLGALSPRALVGPAGYNLSYEAAALGIPHFAVPRPRRFDDQERRARAVAIRPSDPVALEAGVLAALERSAGTARGAALPVAALADALA